jgi:hypothetical protein
MGTATTFEAMPSDNLALVALTNAYPVGFPEILAAQSSISSSPAPFVAIGQRWPAPYLWQ